MTKLWIDPNMVIRWHQKWPLEPVPGIPSEMKFHHQRLAQAKAESLPVEYSNGEPVTNVGVKPDSFFEVNGEVVVLWQYYGHEWRDCVGDPVNYMDYTTRKVARLKPASSAMRFTEGMGVEIIGTKNYDFLATDSINPINPNVAIGWKAGDHPDSIFTREDVRVMIEQDRAEALKDIRSRILEGVDAKLHFINKDAQRQAIEAVSKTLDELNIK